MCDNEVNSTALYNPGNAAQNYSGNAAHDYQGNAAYNYQGNAAKTYWGRTAQFYPGNAAGEQIMNQPPWPFIPPWGPWFSPPGLLSSSLRAQTVEASTPGPSGMKEDTVTPFVSESERGDLLSSEDSELSEGEEEMIAPPAKHPKLEKETDVLLKASTEKPLEHEKRKKLIARFPLPASDAAHPPKIG